MGYIVVSCIVILVIDALGAKKFEEIANMKGHQGYFWWCFWLGLAGWAMVIALPDRGVMPSRDSVPVKQAVSEPDDTLPDL